MSFTRVFTYDTAFAQIEAEDTIDLAAISIDTLIAGKDSSYLLSNVEESILYHHEANGDVTLYTPDITIPVVNITMPEHWSVLPIKSKTASILAFEVDTVGEIQGMEAEVFARRSTGYLGEGVLTVNGEQLAVSKVYMRSLVQVTVMGQLSQTEQQTEYWYSPKLKTFVAYRKWTWSNHSFAPEPNGGVMMTLKSYTR
jgi:hypothetical protein